MASVCLVRVAVDRRAAKSFQWEALLLVNDIAHFESDIMPSKAVVYFLRAAWYLMR